MTYYLCITFSIGGIAGLEFRTKQDFLEETKGDNQVKLIGEWSDWDGYKTEIVIN